MLRRRFLLRRAVLGGPFVRRPRILGTAVIGGLGYLIGRSTGRPSTSASQPGPYQPGSSDQLASGPTSGDVPSNLPRMPGAP